MAGSLPPADKDIERRCEKRAKKEGKKGLSNNKNRDASVIEKKKENQK